jgi:ABC-type glycerol-3-phosphate transport system substrate-binding protein
LDTPLNLYNWNSDVVVTFIALKYIGGKWIDGFSQPAMVDALKRFKYLYDEKLVPCIINSVP